MCAYFTSIWVHCFSGVHVFVIAYRFVWLCCMLWYLFNSYGMNEFLDLHSLSHFFFRLSIAWVWAFSSLIQPMSPFIPCSWVGWCSCHATALFLLWYHLPLFTLLLLLDLRAKMLAMLVSYIIPSFSLYCPVFLLGQFIQHLKLPRPILFLGHPQPISFFGHPWPISFFPTSYILMGFC